ncbi:MAG: stage III sporulation protein AC [Clostridia bacterium]|nr:stage III sporulation protein AC [Clostridia bacterium]
MEVDLIFKIAAIGIIVAVMNQILSKSDKGEYAMLITLAGIILVVVMLIPEIEELFSKVRGILDY